MRNEVVNFLDINLSVKEDEIKSSVFYKVTDSHSYLKYGSSHPRSCKDAIPFSQFLRLKRLCSDNQDYRLKEKEMESFFLARDYPMRIISKAKERVASVTRAQAMKPKNQNQAKDRVILTLTYNSYSKTINQNNLWGNREEGRR